MKLYCDENIPPSLARGLEALQQRLERIDGLHLEVVPFRDRFARGLADEDWIPEVGRERAIVMTHDTNLKRRRQQLALLQQHGIRVVFIVRPSKRSSYWDTVVQVLRAWPRVRELVSANLEKPDLLITIPASGKPKLSQ